MQYALRFRFAAVRVTKINSITNSLNCLGCDPAIPLLDIYPKHALPYHKDICSTILIIIARNKKHLGYSSKEEWIKNVVQLHNEILFSCLKTDIMKFTGKWILNEVTQTQKINMVCIHF